MLNDLASLDGLLSVTGRISGTTVTLYASTLTKLVTLTDSSGYHAPLTAQGFTQLALAPAGTQFRGVALAPEGTIPASPG